MQFSTVLAIHSWTLYSIAVSFMISRIIFRRITLSSFKKFQADDWLMICGLLPFTASIVLANQVSDFQSASQRKFRYVLEEMQIITVWLVKACLLALYWRIFTVEISPWKRHTLKVLSAFCCLSFLAVQFTLLASCQPTEAQWDLETSKSQCVTYQLDSIMNLALNVPSTVFIMMFPIPFIPTPRRLLLAVLLILSLLIVLAGIRSRVMILQNPSSSRYINWYTSEASLSMIFANLPFLTSLVVATAPSRIRGFSNNLRSSSQLGNLPQWPRSRLGSLNDGSVCRSWEGKNEIKARLDAYEIDTSRKSSPEPHSPVDVEKANAWDSHDQIVQQEDARETQSSDDSNSQASCRSSEESTFITLDQEDIDQIIDDRTPPPVSVPEPAKTGERRTSLPKMRLSGGLAEMANTSRSKSTPTKEAVEP